MPTLQRILSELTRGDREDALRDYVEMEVGILAAAVLSRPAHAHQMQDTWPNAQCKGA